MSLGVIPLPDRPERIDVFVLKSSYDRLQAENAKLRELVRDLAICACGKYCYGCPHQYDGCDRDERIRELGVEVDA